MKLLAGIVGLRRGASYFKPLNRHENVEVVAVCDVVPDRAEEFAKQNNIKYFYTEYKEFLECNLDIVVVATPLPLHKEHVVEALKSGSHVLSEVPAAASLNECEQLVKEVEKSGLKYMMAENWNYMPIIQSWKQMIDDGRLGKIIYAEAEYVHDIRFLMKEDGKKTWRATMPPIHYCTHSLGPLLYLMNDRCVSAIGLHTEGNIAPELSAIDMEVGIFKTERGALIKLLVGFTVPRPITLWYVLYGTKGFVEGKRCEWHKDWDEPKGYLEDMLSLKNIVTYSQLTKYQCHSYRMGETEQAVVNGFIDSILNDTKPPIDIYDAMDYTVPGICAHLSAQAGGKPVKVPNYRK